MTGGDAFAVEATGITKSFPADYRLTTWFRRGGKRGERRTVLRDVNLAIRRGEIFGVLGANGAGKTTLLKMLVTLLLPDAGRIRIDGIDAVAHPLEVKRHVGFALGGERTFYNKLSARRNLEFFGTLCDLDSVTLRKRIAEVIEIVDLGTDLERPVMSFSSGMRQRLAVARALLGDPPILIFDEPTRAVDPVHALELRGLIRDTLARRLGKTVLLSTNALEEAWSCCERVAILGAGRVVAVDSPEALVAKFSERRRFAIAFDTVAAGLEARLRSLDGVSEVEFKDGVALVSVELRGRNFTELLATLATDGSVIRSLRELDDALFDVFRATATQTADA
jgi:ABC-2 type transport system ATP-binding protein